MRLEGPGDELREHLPRVTGGQVPPRACCIAQVQADGDGGNAHEARLHRGGDGAGVDHVDPDVGAGVDAADDQVDRLGHQLGHGELHAVRGLALDRDAFKKVARAVLTQHAVGSGSDLAMKGHSVALSGLHIGWGHDNNLAHVAHGVVERREPRGRNAVVIG